MKRPLEDYSADELTRLDYIDLLELRADAFARHVAGMTVPAELQAWAALMAQRFGPRVKVWKNRLGWLEALMVVRYGEDPMKWPPAFSTDDVARAQAWASGSAVGGMRASVPNGIVYLDSGPATSFLGSFEVGALLAGMVGQLLGLLSLLGLGALATALTDFWENDIQDALWRGRALTQPTDHYFALFTAAPGETGGGTEVSGGSYARVQVTADFNQFLGTGGETTNTDSAGTGGQISNRNSIAFPAPTANWGSITHMAVFDASSNGNMRTYAALTAAKTVNNGDPAPSFPAASFTFTLA